MAKGVDKGHDATQELSASQLVASLPPRRPNPQNDASLWMRNVVGSDDFAPTRPAAPKRRIWPLMVVGTIAIAAAGVGYFVLTRGTKKPEAAPAAASTTPITPAPTTPAPAPPPTPAIAATAPTPAEVSAPIDATAVPAATVEAGQATVSVVEAKAAAVGHAASAAGTGFTEKRTRKQTTSKKKAAAKPTSKSAPPKRK